MKRGIVIGKFLPFHKGHKALIEFALKHCNELVVLIVTGKNDPVPEKQRYQWLKELYDIKRVCIEYTVDLLPDIRVAQKLWADYIIQRFPDVKVIFTSADYGDMFARSMGIEHLYFDRDKKKDYAASSEIRNNPYKYWFLLPEAVRPYYIKKVCIYGYESTHKFSLTEKLAEYFKTEYVHKMVHDVLGERDIKFEDIPLIAMAHAAEILKLQKTANKVLFCDTDFITAKIFSKHYFNKVPEFPEWSEKANKFDLYLFYEDKPGGKPAEGGLKYQHRDWFFSEMEEAGINYYLINGSEEDKFLKSCNAVRQLLSD